MPDDGVCMNRQAAMAEARWLRAAANIQLSRDLARPWCISTFDVRTTTPPRSRPCLIPSQHCFTTGPKVRQPFMSTSPSAPQTTALTPFEYGRLKHDGAIRILTLYPGRADEPLVGRLTVEDVNAGVDYEAISYVWGSLDRCAQMVCDGKVLPLTQSIHDALRRMRHPSEPRRLWADQLCINQDDLAERSHQVSLMNTLYKNARRILVWLGNDEQGLAHGAMHMVHHLHDVFEDDKLHEVFRIAHSDGLAKQNQELWVPLSSLTKLPWVSFVYLCR